MAQWYKLVGHDPVPVDSLEEWARGFELIDRHVANEEIGPFRVSTVFLGLNHRFGVGPPLLFETMIFGPDGHDLDQWQDRCSTWAEAETMHATAVALARAAIN